MIQKIVEKEKQMRWLEKDNRVEKYIQGVIYKELCYYSKWKSDFHGHRLTGISTLALGMAIYSASVGLWILVLN